MKFLSMKEYFWILEKFNFWKRNVSELGDMAF